MIFQHTLKQLLSGQKTETSRIVKSGDYTWMKGEMNAHWSAHGTIKTYSQVMNESKSKHYLRFEVGKDYAIQPARTAKSIGRFRILDIWRQDVRTLTPEQVQAEGFEGYAHFITIWCKMYDVYAYEHITDPIGADSDIVDPYPYRFTMGDYLDYRSDECYMAWRLRIEMLYETINWNAVPQDALPPWRKWTTVNLSSE